MSLAQLMNDAMTRAHNNRVSWTFFAPAHVLGNLGYPGFERFSKTAQRRRKRRARYNRGRTGVRPRKRGGR